MLSVFIIAAQQMTVTDQLLFTVIINHSVTVSGTVVGKRFNQLKMWEE